MEGKSAIVLVYEVAEVSMLLTLSHYLYYSNSGDLKGKRVAFLAPPSAAYVITQWAIWRSGGVAVPLCITHPPAERQYYVS